jgi:hypothetical protein
MKLEGATYMDIMKMGGGKMREIKEKNNIN